MERICLLLTSFLASVSCQRSSFEITSINGLPTANRNPGTSGGSFSITSINGRPVNGDRGSLIDTNRMRVEVQLVHFDNPESVMYNNKFCDTASKCDPGFIADLDTKTPLAPWPGPKPFSAFEKVFEATNNDMVVLGRSVIRDVCSGANVANLRVQVNDIDDVTQPDLIDEYDCIFDIGRIASDISSAEWSTVLECRSLHHPTKPFVKLFYRHREYALPRDSFAQC